MSQTTIEHTFAGSATDITYRVWPNPDARYIVVLAHGYGEHVGRYEDVGEFLVNRGGVVAAPDHAGHGRSGGERVLIEDYDAVVDDVHSVVTRMRAEHPGLPVALVGHSMGGMIAARYAQRHRDELACLVLSGPVLGSWSAATELLGADEIPDDPIDVSTLSRDPEVGRRYAEDELVWHGAFKRPTLEALDRALKAINDGPKLTGLPTLWLHGAEDRLVPIDETRAGIETLEFDPLITHVYDEARHEVFNETNSHEVLATTAAFIDANTAPRG
jgi:alpha-beta hydrolase superfamily lysophospholipase